MKSRIVPLTGFGLLGMLVAVPAAAGNPSFDCDVARHAVEKLICEDDELAELDIKLTRAYAGALARAPASQVGEIRSSQNAWRRAMMRCERDEDERACTLAAYMSRLGQF